MLCRRNTTSSSKRKTLAQLDAAFGVISAGSGEIEALHHALKSKVKDVIFALYRDFPDPQTCLAASNAGLPQRAMNGAQARSTCRMILGDGQ